MKSGRATTLTSATSSIHQLMLLLPLHPALAMKKSRVT
jgi:hypothetical protein